MARITIEDCLKKINNRFALIHMASKRVRELRKGEEPTIVSRNRDIVVSLREIAAGNIGLSEPANEKHAPEILIQAQAEHSEYPEDRSTGAEGDVKSSNAEGN